MSPADMEKRAPAAWKIGKPVPLPGFSSERMSTPQPR